MATAEEIRIKALVKADRDRVKAERDAYVATHDDAVLDQQTRPTFMTG